MTNLPLGRLDYCCQEPSCGYTSFVRLSDWWKTKSCRSCHQRCRDCSLLKAANKARKALGVTKLKEKLTRKLT